MTEQTPQDRKDAKWQRQQRKQWPKRYQGYQQQKKKDPEEIPVLKYGPNNNFSKFKEAISKTALKDYGQLGKLIKLGAYYQPQEPTVNDYDLVNNPLGVNKAAYLEDMKEHRKETNKMRSEQLIRWDCGF